MRLGEHSASKNGRPAGLRPWPAGVACASAVTGCLCLRHGLRIETCPVCAAEPLRKVSGPATAARQRACWLLDCLSLCLTVLDTGLVVRHGVRAGTPHRTASTELPRHRASQIDPKDGPSGNGQAPYALTTRRCRHRERCPRCRCALARVAVARGGAPRTELCLNIPSGGGPAGQS